MNRAEKFLGAVLQKQADASFVVECGVNGKQG